MKEQIIKILEKHLKKSSDEIENLIEIPKDYSKGDFAFPCFSFAKEKKIPPQKIAEEIVEKIGKQKDFEKIESVGPYINFYQNRKKLAIDLIKEVEKEKENFGKGKGKGIKTMIEFSQPNTHKAFHVGHIRGTSVGESISRILEFYGDKVIRANYSGDTGMHIAKWIWCYKNFHNKEKLSEEESWIAGIYVDAVKRLDENKEFQKEVDQINLKLETQEDKEINELWKKTRKLSIDSWKRIYKELNTSFDVHFFESEVEKRAKEISKELVEKGIAIVDDGATIIKFDDENLGVWVLLRKDGTVLYSAKDLALFERKFKEFKIEKNVYVIGAEQTHHVHQLFKTLELMKAPNYEKCYFVPISEVRLPTGKMSSRTGENILYSEFLEEIMDYTKEKIKERDEKIKEKELNQRALKVCIAAIKYSMLKQGTNRGIVFDKKEALNFEGDTGPYIQYAYARASSIIRKFGKGDKIEKIDFLEEKETELILRMNEFNSICENAYKQMNPSIIANYSFRLAQTFNEFYHSCPVGGDEKENFRIHLVNSFRQILKNSLYLLGIDTIEEM